MKCPECGSKKIEVLETRHSGKKIRRRRECHECYLKFTTYEMYLGDGSLRQLEVIESLEEEISDYIRELKRLKKEMRDSLDNRPH